MTIVVQLNLAQNGLAESATPWHELLGARFRQLGFTHNASLIDSKKMVVDVHYARVDDMMIAAATLPCYYFLACKIYHIR